MSNVLALRPDVPIITEKEREALAIIGAAIGESIGASVVVPTFEGAPWPKPDAQGPQAVQQLVNGSNGTDIADSVYEVAGTVALWPLSVMCRLGTSAVVADRTVALEYRTPDDVRYLVAGAQAIVQASDAQSFCWHPEATADQWPIEDAALSPLPQQHLYPGCKLALRIWNGQTGDVLDQVMISARFDPIMLDEDS